MRKKMPLRFSNETGWTHYPPTPIPYEDPNDEPEATYSFFWSHYLIHKVNVLIQSEGMDPLKAIHIVEETHLKRRHNRLLKK